MTYALTAESYMEAGWDTPMPLPRGQKYPPPTGATGNVPDVSDETIDKWLAESDDDCNIGVRMPRFADYEVIGIDVDHHDDKRGGDTIATAEATHGKLPETFRSSSRGSRGRHGIYFFKAPVGIKWAGQIGPAVEIIQRSHRYAVVAPSVVEGRIYRWYDADGDEWPTPKIDSLPMLPDAWVKAFTKGAAKDRAPIAPENQIGGMAEAMDWLAKEIPGFHGGRSSIMHKASDPDRLQEEAIGGSHDMITARVHEVVRLGCEGHHGLGQALASIKKAFLDEVLGVYSGRSRRSEEAAENEWQRSLLGEVQKLRQDVDDDLVMISNLSGFGPEDEEEVDPLEASFRDAISKRPETVDPDEYPANDYGSGKMIAEYWGANLRSISESDRDWVLWADDQMSWQRLTSERLYHRVAIPAVHDRLQRAEQSAFEAGQRCAEMGEDEAAKEEFAKAKACRDRATQAGNRQKLESMLSVARTEQGVPISWARFDADDMKIGTSNGIIDLHVAKDAPKPTEVDLTTLLRLARPDDCISLNTKTAFNIHTESPAWEKYLDTFLPDKQYRRFVRKVMGYSMLGNNSRRLMIFLQGGTSTGKSTLLEAVMGATGDYSTTVNVNEIFRERSDGGPNPGLVQALPKRIITSSEIGQHHFLHADVIKRMTGGDHLSARELYSNKMVGRVPAFTPIIATNSMPTIKDGDAALWRRLLVLPFDHQVSSANVIEQKLTEDQDAMEAVLVWLIQGALDYMENGLDQEKWPDQCVERAKEFVAGTSDFQSFLSRCTAEAPGKHVVCDDLYKLYRSWSAGESLPEKDWLTKTNFSRQMKTNGFDTVKTSKTEDGVKIYIRKYKDIALQAQ